MSSWVDNFIATPAVGIRFRTPWTAVFRYGELLGLVLKNLDDNKISFQVATPGTATFIVDREDGFQYLLDPTGIAVEFKYKATAVQGSGKLPEFKALKIEPYSVLVQKVKEQLLDVVVEMSRAIPSLEGDRFGVVANCRIPLAREPPGLKAIFDHIGAPWKRPLRLFDGNFLATLEEDQAHLVQCHYKLKLDRSAEEPEIAVTLDWQDLRNPGFSLGKGFGAIVQPMVVRALGYFERVGEGTIDVD